MRIHGQVLREGAGKGSQALSCLSKRPTGARDKSEHMWASICSTGLLLWLENDLASESLADDISIG
jgi:hypothetical protein